MTTSAGSQDALDLDLDLKCPICDENFSTSAATARSSATGDDDRTPAVLSCCGQTTCVACFETHRASKAAELAGNRKKIPCMMCNKLCHCERDTPIAAKGKIAISIDDYCESLQRKGRSAAVESSAHAGDVHGKRSSSQKSAGNKKSRKKARVQENAAARRNSGANATDPRQTGGEGASDEAAVQVPGRRFSFAADDGKKGSTRSRKDACRALAMLSDNLRDAFLWKVSPACREKNTLRDVRFNRGIFRYESSNTKVLEDDFILQAMVIFLISRLEHGLSAQKMLQHLTIWADCYGKHSCLSLLENLWENEIDDLVKEKKLSKKFLGHEDNYYAFVRGYQAGVPVGDQWHRRSDKMRGMLHLLGEQAIVQFALKLSEDKPEYPGIAADTINLCFHSGSMDAAFALFDAAKMAERDGLDFCNEAKLCLAKLFMASQLEQVP